MNLNRTIKSKYFFLLACVVCYLLAFIINHNVYRDSSRIINAFEERLHQKESRVERELGVLSAQPDSLLCININEHYKGLYEDHGVLFLIYQEDSLVAWTDHTVAFEDMFSNGVLKNKVIRLKSGWYEVLEKRVGTKAFLAIILIKNEYPIENKYLSKSFQNDYNLDENIEISFNRASSWHPILDKKGNYLFSLLINEIQDSNIYYLLIRIILISIGSIFLILFIGRITAYLKKFVGGFFSALFFLLVLVVIRFLSIEYRFPEVLYELELFQPQLYGDANFIWLSSLGDAFVNLLIIACLSYYLYRSPDLNLRLHSVPAKSAAVIFIFLFVYLLSCFVNQFIIGLIFNSNISFNTNNLFNLDIYSYISFIAVGLAALSLYFIAEKLTTSIHTFNLNVKLLIGLLGLSIIIITVISHIRGELDEILFLWSAFLVVIIYVSKYHFIFKSYLSKVAVFILIISFYESHVFTKFSLRKENEYRLILADKLSSEQDPLAEYLFSEAVNKIQNDTLLIKSMTDDQIHQRLIQKYFNGYWKKYQISISVNDSSSEHHAGYGQSIKESLIYLSDPSGKIRLTGLIPIYHDNQIFYITVTFDSKLFSERLGFPELLISQDNKVYDGLKEYSFAKYKNNLLVSFYGRYSYPLVNNRFNHIEPSGSLFFEEKENDHLIYRNDAGSFVILTKPKDSFFNQVTTFSFLFSFYSLILIFILLFERISLGKFSFTAISLKNKIQILLVSLVLTSLLITGFITVMYITKQFEEGAKESAKEKIHETLKELRKDSEFQNVFSPEHAENTLQNVAVVFSNDIIIYDVKGNYLSSSISKLFDEGLLSKKMSPDAYFKLFVENESEVIHNEKIGNLSYLSAYIPFKDSEGRLSGYMNMPYFSKQDDLQKEISSFSGAIINIYVFLFLLSVVTAILISNIVTSPLRIIQEKIGAVKLGRKNELIQWNKTDEIGSLIQEYNRMVTELMKSAELLAKSERESAWREMAKQVAHEIKNPLTPMKLSIQHFERTWNKDELNIDEKIRRFTQSLIEQIEILSSIADEFSSFAKMPRAINEKVNLKLLLTNVIDLYKNSSQQSIIYLDDIDTDAYVFCDKEQLLRALNNLVKNALQAIPEDREGRVEVILKKETDSFVIQIKDNGTGIDKEQTNKIFVPNFTTKTGGTGLGLAMTKNIIEGFKGKIWFVTEEEKGTSFFISLPVHAPNSM